MNVAALIIQLLSGAAGGNLAGKLMASSSLGPVGNSIAGIIGGGLGGQLFSRLTASANGGLDIVSIVSSLVGGGVGGAVLMALVGVLKSMIGKPE
jgi:uncharacterized membrane protein YeaQ/YmgE (transglycosylase-associated protein family)